MAVPRLWVRGLRGQDLSIWSGVLEMKQRRDDFEETLRGGEDNPVGGFLEDLGLETRIQGALLAVAPATGLRVDVDADRGIVYLRGEVASEWQRAEAERIVRETIGGGAVEIRNELTVDPNLPRLPHP